MEEQNNSWWNRLRYKYRFSVMNEDTLSEAWHVRLSRLGALTIFCLMFFFTLALLAILILCTPIRNILPGYSESIRQQLIEQSVAVDSLTLSVDLQHQYLDVVKQVVAGEISSDTIRSLDSMQIVARAQLLEIKNEATEEFMAQYEEKDKDNLLLFDVQQTAPVATFFRPVRGVVVGPYAHKMGRHGVDIQTPDDETVMSVLAGTVIYVNYELENTYTVIVDHTSYISVYRNAKTALKRVGDVVRAGEAIAVMSEDRTLHFELWQGGESVNPELVIAF